jgi:hypothetical protein
VGLTRGPGYQGSGRPGRMPWDGGKLGIVGVVIIVAFLAWWFIGHGGGSGGSHPTPAPSATSGP